jgi:hypothetical protein
MLFIKSTQWQKWLLPGGLVLVSVLGLVQIPEVATRLFPEHFWEAQRTRTRRHLIRAEMYLGRTEATLEAFHSARKDGVPHLSGFPPVTDLGLRRAIRKTLAAHRRYWEDRIEVEEMFERLKKLSMGTKRKANEIWNYSSK